MNTGTLKLAVIVAAIACKCLLVADDAGWTISLGEPPAKVVPVETLAWTIDVSPPVAAPALSWSIDVGPAVPAVPIALVSAWAIPLCNELCDCEDGCKCEQGKCQCCKPDKVPVAKEPTVASLLGQRLDYGKAVEIADKLRCPLIVARGLDAASTERWATEAQRRRALFAVVGAEVAFSHDGAFRLAWDDSIQKVGIKETLETKIVEPPPMIVSQPWIQPAYFFGSACAGGNCPR